jgi:hypothetical protein
MLVVLAIMLLLAVLAIGLVPRFQERQRASQGIDHVQQWFAVARQWAKRDRIPTGIRLQPNLTTNSPNALFVVDMQYIQQPDDFDPPGSVLSPGANNTVTVSGADFFGGQPNSQQLWQVQPGDYLEIQGGGLVHQIQSVSSSQGNGIGDTLSFVGGSTIPSFSPTTQYRVIRQPRVLAGEPALQMPQNVAIDLTTNQTYVGVGGGGIPTGMITNLGTSGQPIDILFSPSGEVIGPLAGSNTICLWVRDITLDAAAPGEQMLVCIYCRTGFIAAHPVDLTPNPNSPPPLSNPYSYTTTGLSSGM